VWIQNLLVMKLREREAESQGIVEFGANEVAGMTQHDLVTWYFDFQAERCVGHNKVGSANLARIIILNESCFVCKSKVAESIDFKKPNPELK